MWYGTVWNGTGQKEVSDKMSAEVRYGMERYGMVRVGADQFGTGSDIGFRNLGAIRINETSSSCMTEQVVRDAVNAEVRYGMI